MKKNRSKAGKLLHLLWIIPLLLVLAVGVLMYVVPAFETVDRTPVGGSADWMANLDDGLALGEVVLPGTHDSATKNVQLAFFSKCQALTIGEQLEAGYRYLDIRLGADGERLKLMHGFTNCTTSGWPWAGARYLDEVLTQCYDFLAAHPTETVVFAVKQEHGSESVADFERLLDAYVSERPDAWLLTDRIPTVGEARGRLVLMRRYADEANLGTRAGIPLLWDNQSGHDDVSKTADVFDNGAYTLTVQDRYEYDTEDKWNAFRTGMAAGGTGANAVSIHFLSTKGTAAYGHPYRFAKVLNARLSDSTNFRGWLIVDFASAALARTIYMQNGFVR